MAMTERYNNSGAVTIGNILISVNSGVAEHYFGGYITPGPRGRLSNYKSMAALRKITTGATTSQKETPPESPPIPPSTRMGRGRT